MSFEYSSASTHEQPEDPSMSEMRPRALESADSAAFASDGPEPTTLPLTERSALEVRPDYTAEIAEATDTVKDASEFGPTDAKLYYDPAWSSGTVKETLSILALGGNSDDYKMIIAQRRGILECAQDLGITVIATENTKQHNLTDVDYTVIRATHTREEEEAEVRAAVPDIHIPTSVDFVTFNDQPFFPAVAKNNDTHAGTYKYLLDTPEQWQKMQSLLTGEAQVGALDPEAQAAYEDAVARFQTLTPGTDAYTAQERLMSEWDRYIQHIRQPLLGQKTTYFFNYQEYIETPSDRYTSYRVLASASGDILASSLYYSADAKTNSQPIRSAVPAHQLGIGPEGRFDYLTSPHSPIYIGPRPFQSNHSLGGRGIVLDRTENAKPMDDTDREIAAAHGLNPDSPQLPEPLREMSKVLAMTYGRSKGIVVGIDWLQDKNDTYHYLETNGGPGDKAFVDAHYSGTDTIPEQESKKLMNRAALQSIAARHRRNS